jgi:glycine cleavage system H protein
VADIRYTKSHEYLRRDGGLTYLGVTEHAQGQLGDITYVEAPEIGAAVAAGKSCCTVESVKAVAEVYAPAGLKITGFNTRLEDSPELVNKDAEGDGWLITVELDNAADFDSLMDPAAYAAMEK